MRKYIKYGLMCIAGSLSISSCDVMDTEPFESYSEDLVWSTDETANAFVMQTYNKAIPYLAGSGMNTNWEARTPNGVLCSQVGEGIDGLATELGIDVYSNYGFNRFGDLRACNMIIEKATASTGISEKKKKEFVAEAKFLRGIIFFDQARKMGRFVPITRVLTVNDKEAFKTPLTSSVDESYQFVMKDLTDAIEGMSETSLPGRANKYAAHLIRSRAALQAYAYTNKAEYLDIVIESSKAVIESGKYTLTSNYGSMFNDVDPYNKEIILGRYYLKEDNSVGGFNELIRVYPNVSQDDQKESLCPNPLKDENGRSFESWATFFPTQDLVDNYLVIDAKTGEAVSWFESSQYLENVEQLNTASIKIGDVDSYTRKTTNEPRRFPSPQDFLTERSDFALFAHYGALKPSSSQNISEIMYQNRDKRFYATVVYDSCLWKGETVTTNMAGNISQGVRDKEDGGWYNTVTGYYWKKGTYENSGAIHSAKTNYHYVVARLGEAYMNLAEAYLLKNEVSNAVAALNVTRTVHGGLPASTASTLQEAWKDYMTERTCEMVYEGADLYFSYLRWGKYGGFSNYGEAPNGVIRDLNRPVYKIEISRDRKRFCVGQLTLLKSWNRNFTTRRYLFPIPQGEIDTRSAHGINDIQNEGW